MITIHLLLFFVISSMILSSVVCILYVTIENSKAVKKFYRANQNSDISDQNEKESSLVQSPILVTPVFTGYSTQDFLVA